MPKKNTFLSVAMSNTDLTTFYPTSKFDRFIFQRVMENGSLKDDSYILNAFAIDKDGELMGDQIELVEIEDTPSHQIDRRVQFANIVVTKTDLDFIFNNSFPTTDLCLYPQKSKKYPKFVAYKVADAVALSTAKVIAPSPPAH